MLQSYFDFIFVHLRRKVRLRPEVFVNFGPEPDPNPARTRPEKPGPTYNSAPLGCTLANFFLSHWETVIFKQPFSTHPKMYLHYVDDVFAVFDDDKKCDSFLNILNTQHKNLQFTVEKSANTLQFLNVVIKVNEQDVDTWVWRKPTIALAYF